ncbi:hypothetical protein Nepgr_026730 [Nepenthes gracilis]|uniref:Zinc finger CCCH domain-containing protein 41 n=1 Tax=Nepenthes gracilis TaxID=150966 RepID=A0AAD3TAF4_NEPGR|nr:hypothetical protein Nepgr_026730 [Nepenthes gracilis]
MELEISRPAPDGLSPPDCVTDPEEKEISDDDDDDRNHKHRRRETRSQSLGRDQSDQGFTRPNRKRNRPFENGHPLRETDSRSHYNMDRDLSLKFEKRRPVVNYSMVSSDLNLRLNVNQSYSGDSGSVMGRAMSAGRALPIVSNAQNSSWSGFELIPGIPNGGINSIYPLGLQGTLGESINPPLNLGFPRQRCRDFEERGFCLRGDMCPMEHGLNRIVVEDVQSLSQFNLPGSLPNAHLFGTHAGTGYMPPVTALSTLITSKGTLINSKGPHSRISKLGTDDNRFSLDGALPGPVDATGAEVYDPDQPLWNNDCPETSTALLPLHPSNIDEPESLMDSKPSDQLDRTNGSAVGLQSTSSSVWGRIAIGKNRLELKEKMDSRINYSENTVSGIKENQVASSSFRGTSLQGKRLNAVKAVDSSSKLQNDIGCSVRKPSQKAQRTLFVNGIPLKDNKKEALLAHFRKFGEIIDIYIPSNSERAFVQFSKKEEAEAALKAPDAVMGNRFIKMWWANRDNVPDDGMRSGNNAPILTHDVSAASIPVHPTVGKGKYNLQVTIPKVSVAHASDSPVMSGNDSKAAVINGRKAPSPSLKKLHNLELLEEIRRKQELLDQKRNEFRQQLDKLQKHTTGIKDEITADGAGKRVKSGIIASTVKAGTPKSAGSSSLSEVLVDKCQTNTVSNSPRVDSASSLQQESPSMKQTSHQLATVGGCLPKSKYKLDSQSMTFRVDSPLPVGFADVCTLRDHFSSYGDLSNVELEDAEVQDSHPQVDAPETAKNYSARVSFTTHSAAERAFMNGNSWNGHNLQFTWITSNSSTGERDTVPTPKGPSNAEVPYADSIPKVISKSRENPPPALKGPFDPEAQQSTDKLIEVEESIADQMEAGKNFESSETLVSEEERDSSQGEAC